MHRGRNLGLTALAAVLLGLLYLYLDGGAPGELPAQAVESTPAYWMLYERDPSEFRDMTVTLASGESYRVRSDMVFQDGQLLGVQNTLGQPVVVEHQPGFALDVTGYQMMLLVAQHIPVTAKYDALDLEACGLASPAARLEIAYDDGETLTLSIGNLTASGASCYVRLSGDTAVYLAPYDLHQVMTRSLKEQHALPGPLNVDVDSAVQIAVDGPTVERVIATRYGGDRLLPWRMDTPLVHDGSTERIAAFLAGLCAVHAEAYETTVEDAAALAAYGLDEPLRLIAAFSDGTIRDIHVGADAGGGMVYVRMDSTGDIYLLSRTQLDFAADASLEGLLDRFVALVPITELSQLIVTWGQERYVLTPNWINGEDTVAAGYTVNGVDVPLADFSTLYSAVIGLQFDQVINAKADGTPEACLKFHLRDGTQRQVTLYDYDAFYTLAVTDGGGRFLIRNTRVKAMINTLQEDAYAAK